MRYAAIRSFDVTNGPGSGVSLFVQGCPFHCYNCFNQQTWDFNGGKEWTKETEERFLKLVGRDYIKRVSFLGGEPLADQNAKTVYELIKKIHELYPDKQIWIYTGFKIENIIMYADLNDSAHYRSGATFNADILVDGQFEYDKRDLTLAFRGSSNQRIIDIKKTLEQYGETKELILWDND